MKIKAKKLLSIAFMLCVMLSLINPMQIQAAVKLNATKKTLSVGQTFTLDLTGTYHKAKWSSSKSSVASVNQNGKVTAKKSGNTTITANVSGKILKCKIKVKKSNINPRTIYKDKSVVVKLLGISEPNYLGGYDIELQIENLTENSLTVQNRETSINGYMVTKSLLSTNISPGKKVKCTLIVYGDIADEIPVSKIKSMETKLAIVDMEDFDTYYETEVFTII